MYIYIDGLRPPAKRDRCSTFEVDYYFTTSPTWPEAVSASAMRSTFDRLDRCHRHLDL